MCWAQFSSMLKYLLTSTLFISLVSCSVQIKTENTTLEKLGSTFLDDLYNRRYQKCIASMDDTVIVIAKSVNLDSAFIGLSDKIRNDYGGQITSTLISNEKTFHENLPATFLIFKVESSTRFGYYFFYISDRSNKIFLVSEFSRVKQKRI